MHVERFAPSPTGRLHLGHAYSALLGHARAREAGGLWRLRIEDLDEGRVRPEFSDAIIEDLAWLGLDPDGPVLWQSSRRAAHEAALARLAEMGLLYRCTCTRRDIELALGAPQEGDGATGLPYPGTCRGQETDPALPHALRLDMEAALGRIGAVWPQFEETGEGPCGEHGTIPLDAMGLAEMTGDIVLRRKDGAAAYHLAVVLDDAGQSVTHVTRGRDLYAATQIHLLLAEVLSLPVPVYHHHQLIRDAEGRRLAKRSDALALSTLRARGVTPDQIAARVGLSCPARSAR